VCEAGQGRVLPNPIQVLQEGPLPTRVPPTFPVRLDEIAEVLPVSIFHVLCALPCRGCGLATERPREPFATRVESGQSVWIRVEPDRSFRPRFDPDDWSVVGRAWKPFLCFADRGTVPLDGRIRLRVTACDGKGSDRRRRAVGSREGAPGGTTIEPIAVSHIRNRRLRCGFRSPGKASSNPALPLDPVSSTLAGGTAGQSGHQSREAS
jgi:hypothetical protein